MSSSNLVELIKEDPRFKLDIVYARKDNFMGFVAYSKPVCYLHKDLISPMKAIQSDLEKVGLSLKVFDGYRPLPVQQQMWDLIQNEMYVSNPAKNKGRHTRGTAVDVTIIDRYNKEVEMPSGFDEFSNRAHGNYMDASSTAIKNREFLKSLMTKHGFVAYPFEWWHFDFQGWENYPPLSITFEELC
jgi:D-alanyl-D-alanine dipeptidase